MPEEPAPEGPRRSLPAAPPVPLATRAPDLAVGGSGSRSLVAREMVFGEDAERAAELLARTAAAVGPALELEPEPEHGGGGGAGSPLLGGRLPSPSPSLSADLAPDTGLGYCWEFSFNARWSAIPDEFQPGLEAAFLAGDVSHTFETAKFPYRFDLANMLQHNQKTTRTRLLRRTPPAEHSALLSPSPRSPLPVHRHAGVDSLQLLGLDFRGPALVRCHGMKECYRRNFFECQAVCTSPAAFESQAAQSLHPGAAGSPLLNGGQLRGKIVFTQHCGSVGAKVHALSQHFPLLIIIVNLEGAGGFSSMKHTPLADDAFFRGKGGTRERRQAGEPWQVQLSAGAAGTKYRVPVLGLECNRAFGGPELSESKALLEFRRWFLGSSADAGSGGRSSEVAVVSALVFHGSEVAAVHSCRPGPFPHRGLMLWKSGEVRQQVLEGQLVSWSYTVMDTSKVGVRHCLSLHFTAFHRISPWYYCRRGRELRGPC